MSEITHQHPIESRFTSNLVDNLNAEVSIGTVTSVAEAVRWLSYTYLNVRMRKNPFNYGMDWKDVQEADGLVVKRGSLIMSAAKTLAKAQMVTYHPDTGFIAPKDLGRTASNFYISNTTVSMFNAVMIPRMTEADVFGILYFLSY